MNPYTIIGIVLFVVGILAAIVWVVREYATVKSAAIGSLATGMVLIVLYGVHFPHA